MIISYDYGHGTGNDRGAEGYLNEEKVIRQYGPVCVNELKRRGHTLINCTPSGNMDLIGSLSYRTNHANASGSKLHLCFHVDAFKTTSSAMGAEIEVASDAGAKYGQSVLNEICKLGFKNRGVKRPQLYVTGHTNAVAILIEPFFCDSKADIALYNCNTLGAAIAKGIINIIGGNKETTVIAKPVVKPAVKLVSAASTNKEVFRVVTGSFSDEANADKRIAELKKLGIASFKTQK